MTGRVVTKLDYFLLNKQQSLAIATSKEITAIAYQAIVNALLKALNGLTN